MTSWQDFVSSISIHALREEGDAIPLVMIEPGNEFLSTPSASRATCPCTPQVGYSIHFYPRPPRGGRRNAVCFPADHIVISIHALREEGDGVLQVSVFEVNLFLSTPSARRATNTLLSIIW